MNEASSESPLKIPDAEDLEENGNYEGNQDTLFDEIVDSIAAEAASSSNNIASTGDVVDKASDHDELVANAQLDVENQLDKTMDGNDTYIANMSHKQVESVEEMKEIDDEDEASTDMDARNPMAAQYNQAKIDRSKEKDCEANDITTTTIGTSEAQDYIDKLGQPSLSPTEKKKVSFDEASVSASPSRKTAKYSKTSRKARGRRTKQPVPIEEERKKQERPITQFCRYCFDLARILVQIIWPLVLLIITGTLEIALIAAMYFRSSGNNLGGSAFAWHMNALLALLMIMTVVVVIHLYWEYVCYWCKNSFKNRGNSGSKKDDSSTESDEETPRSKRRRRMRRHSDQDEDDDEEEGEEETTGSHKSGRRHTKPFVTYVKKRTGRLLHHVCVPLFLILAVLTEVGFLLTMPRSSFMPLVPPFGEDAISDYGEYQAADCDVEEIFKQAKDFFRNNTKLDLDSVRVVYGGTAFDINIEAKAFDNTIYMPKYTCPSVGLMVHELVHIWQEQTGYWHGKGGARRALKYLVDSRKCQQCMYDYGGYEALRLNWGLALSGDTKMADIKREYGPKQMAMIVQDYYATYNRCHPATSEEDAVKPPVELSFNDETNTFNVLNTTNTTDSINGTVTEVTSIGPFTLKDAKAGELSLPSYCEPLEFYAKQVLQA